MRRLQFTKLQLITHAASLAPLALLIIDYFRDNLTVNPIQAITFRTGRYALTLLVLSLACSPLSSIFNFKPALKLRRPLGLYAFMYASLHLLTFVGLDYGFDLELIRDAIFEKRYALMGLATFLLLLPMALTSTKGWQRRLGKSWKLYHRLVYLAGLLAVVHFVWLVKSDIRRPLAYGAVVALLLIARLPVVHQTASRLRGWLVGRLYSPAAGSSDHGEPGPLNAAIK